MSETDQQHIITGEPVTNHGGHSRRESASYGPALVRVFGAENEEVLPSELAVRAWEEFAATSQRPSGRVIGDIELMLEYGILTPGDDPSYVRLSAVGQRLARILRPSPEASGGMQKAV